ncbi:P-type conjugative transfer protein TrbL [Phenylobacterium montanum]|uniref:P-type conjugative transfer protein TrbL n=1 Tax=Phenylobacterium montanum TaxID=2823693 RepID=A0A975IYY6_9CAUL|nr:P-type conjugative transfer protein TrbL [Caulobacter sp. S6]QUD90931.1 P-type conjugative transfer protein TrbL [Caulobacter sp. S6]
MATADPAVLDDFLNKFRSQVDAGFGLIQGDVSATLASLVVISIVITALMWAIDENQNVLASLVRKILLVGFFAFLVAQWPTLTKTVVNGFAALGLKAGGGGMSLSTFTTSPSQIVMAGIKVIAGLMQYVKKISPGPIEFFAHIDVVAMAIVAAIGILIAFVILAVEIVVTIIEFHIVTLVAFVTVPFGVLTQTSFMSERAIGYVVSVGIKLMALAIVVSLGTTVFDNYSVSPDPGIGEDVGLLLAAVVMVMLALKIPAIAAALISGGPQLSSGGALMGAAGVAAGVAGAGLAMRAVGGAVASGWAAGGGQVAAARSAAGAIPSGGGSAPTPGGGPGAADFARAPVSSAVSSLRSAGGRLFGAGMAEGGSDDEAPPPPSPADTVARAEARRSGLAAAAQTAAATAAQGEESGAGMSATPIPPEEPPTGAGT